MKIMLCIECQNVVFIRLLFVSCLSMIKHFYSSSITVYLYDFVLKSKDEPFDYGIGITCDFIDDSYFQVFICTYHYLVSRNNHAYLPYPPPTPPPLKRAWFHIDKKRKTTQKAHSVILNPIKVFLHYEGICSKKHCDCFWMLLLLIYGSN